jgi:glycosyltransferase involved in cell wall biosynthesis
MTSSKQFSVVIPTFRRPEMLRRAVLTCLEQEDVAPEQMEIVVVDNSADASARASVDALQATTAIGLLRYVHEPRPGISHARNAGIFNATGEFIAFLDDDEEAGSLWLKSLGDCLVRAGAEAVMGPVSYYFDTTSPTELEFLRWFYEREWDGESGQEISSRGGMGNCMIRRDQCTLNDHPFDPALGLTGGEDTRFMIELRGRGGRVVWCQEARVTEYCPPSRAKLSFILRRSVRKGQLHVRGLTWRRRAVVAKIVRAMLVGAGQFAILGPAGMLLWYVDRNAAKKCLVKAALGAGKVYWPSFVTLKEYGGT